MEQRFEQGLKIPVHRVETLIRLKFLKILVQLIILMKTFPDEFVLDFVSAPISKYCFVFYFPITL